MLSYLTQPSIIDIWGKAYKSRVHNSDHPSTFLFKFNNTSKIFPNQENILNITLILNKNILKLINTF